MFVERVFHAELNGAEPYLDNWHIGFMCSRSSKPFRQGESSRLAIALPPRNLKSIVTSVAYAYPAWLLGHEPSGQESSARAMAQQLADELARDCRQVMRADWYRALFPGDAAEERSTKRQLRSRPRPAGPASRPRSEGC